MKAVLMSIRPRWCELIAKGEKTIEVRKTRPKLETPFKVYIYCTKHPKGLITVNRQDEVCNRKVIGEFVCDKIFDICIEMSDPDALPGCQFPATGLTDKEILQYFGNGIAGYGWHVSQLKIYDSPKELGELYKPDYPADFWPRDISIKNPPQSWCYVEELPKGE